MEHLSLVAARDRSLIASDKAFLCLMRVEVLNPQTKALVETLYLANNNEPVTYQGNEYVAFPFSVSMRYEAGAQPTFTVIAYDVHRVIQQRMQQYGGAVGSRVHLMLFLEGKLDAEPEVLDRFEIISASSSDFQVSWTLGMQNLIDQKFPGRTQFRDRCGLRYKGSECGYVGPLPTCSYTLTGSNGCQAHNNAPQFGGFPGLMNNGRRYL